MREFAPAKVNLYLHITGRRSDGYHLIESLVVFAAVGDVVTVRPAGEWSLALRGPYAAALDGEGDNLVTRAAFALAAQVHCDPSVSAVLEKNLPVAAGLGGGSADAAAVLRALCRLWRLDVAEDGMRALALDLGADVPVCLAARPTLVSGIGETLRPAPILPECHLLLVNPGVELPTPKVFEAFAARHEPTPAPSAFGGAVDNVAGLAAALASRRNDLEVPARRLAPAVADVLAWIGAQAGCLLARMSGSGATCFGLFADAATARNAADAARRERPRWWCASAPVLTSVSAPVSVPMPISAQRGGA